MVRTAIQLYTLNDFDVSEPTKIRIAGETDVDGVEVVYDGPPSEQTLQALDETGLEVAGLTAGLGDLLETKTTVAEACRTLDCETVILGYLEPTYFESAQKTRETADLLTSIAASFREEGIQFLYHTHRHEFASLGDRTHFDLLLEETPEIVSFELDLGWIAVAGHDPSTVLLDTADRTTSVHLKDIRIADERFVNLGDGDLDIDQVVRATVDADVDWAVYEHEDPDDPVESVVTGASRLQVLKRLQTTH